MKKNNRQRITSSAPKKQRGIVLVLFTISMVVMLGMAGVALDGAHGMLNKTRLQNLVDAAALSGAKTLDDTNDVVQAEVDARAIFAANAADLGNAEIQGSLGGDLAVTVQFSSTLHPFVPGTSPEQYVRVTAQNLRLPGWFIPVLGFNEKIVGATAVAGPSPTINTACNIAPMMVCGDPNPAVDDFGYELGVHDVLKASTNSFEVGPGNFQLIRLGGAMGGADIREAMAGGYDECASVDDVIPTEPGNTVGPVVQGFNTRFGIYSGPMNGTQSQYPPDVITTEPTPPLTYECAAAGGDGSDTICYQGQPIDENTVFYDHADYEANLANPGSYTYTPIGDGGTGQFNRRTMAVPVGDCTNTTNGQGDVPLLGFLCYHMIQRAEQHGNRSQIYGQFIDAGCPVNGRPGPNPGTGPGPYIIQLYKDEDATAS